MLKSLTIYICLFYPVSLFHYHNDFIIIFHVCSFAHLRYDEVCSDDFSFSNPNTLSKATAFTQMIWKDTNTLGVAKATSKDGDESCSFIAAVYRPPGYCFVFIVLRFDQFSYKYLSQVVYRLNQNKTRLKNYQKLESHVSMCLHFNNKKLGT